MKEAKGRINSLLDNTPIHLSPYPAGFDKETK
jgi:hypothetical protein